MIVYRLLVDGSVEEKIYHRQIWKKFQADQILKNPSCQKQFDQQTIFELLEKPWKYLNLEKTHRELSEMAGVVGRTEEEQREIKREYLREKGISEKQESHSESRLASATSCQKTSDSSNSSQIPSGSNSKISAIKIPTVSEMSMYRVAQTKEDLYRQEFGSLAHN